MTVDEPIHLALEENQRNWWSALAGAASAEMRHALFSPEVLTRHFRHEDHPILGRHLANLSYLLLRPAINAIYGPLGISVDRWTSSRLATGLLFAAVGVAMYFTVGSQCGRWGGFSAAATLALLPRVFGHAHLDALDFQVSAWWFLSFCIFFRAWKSWPATLVFSVLVGFAWATQFSGILVVVPLAIWALANRESRAIRPLVAALVLAPFVWLALMPHWWHDPLGGFWDFLYRSTHRRDYMAHHCFYLGHRYTFGLPWHNALVLMASTIPVGVLGLALVGLARGAWAMGVGLQVWRRRRGTMPNLRHRLAGGLALVVVFWLVLRALPNSPDHDGVRLFLHAFVFLAALAGVGAAELLTWAAALGRESSTMPIPGERRLAYRVGSAVRRFRIPQAACTVAIACAAVELCWIHPYYLSYYSRLVGHPAGARALGLESTYWADGITPEVVDWLNAHAAGTRVFVLWTASLDAVRTLGRLHTQVGVVPAPSVRGALLMQSMGGPQMAQRGAPQDDLVLFSMRQSNFDPLELEGRLVREFAPVRSWGTRDGVPLVMVYRLETAKRLAAPTESH